MIIMNRVCLFAGYNSGKVILPYVFDYLEELSKHADVYYMADGELMDGELEKLSSVCKGAWQKDHGKYDFGSYSELAQKNVGWEKIREYDELIFANDSCFCVQSFDAVFKKMDKSGADAWCLLATDENNKGLIYTFKEYLAIPAKMVPLFCMGSYFLAFRKNVFCDAEFIEFMDSVKNEENRYVVCIKYEMGLTKFLQSREFELSAFIPIVHRNVTIYDEQSFRLLKKGFPLIKIRIFRDNPLSISNVADWLGYVSYHVGATKIYDYVNQIRFNVEETQWGFRPLLNSDLPGINSAPIENWKPPVIFLGIKGFVRLFVPPPLWLAASRWKKNKWLAHADVTHFAPAPQIEFQKDGSKNLSDFIVSRKFSNLIIYLNVARDDIGGGMLSINRFVARTIEMSQELECDVVVSGVPLQNEPVDYTYFEPAAPMIKFDDIVSSCSAERVIIHVPEVFLPAFVEGLHSDLRRWLKRIPELQINIMNQNNDLFPEQVYIEYCRDITDDITITTAHSRYATQSFASTTNCPVSILTPFLPEFYRKPWEKKEKIIVISPDDILEGEIKKDDVLNHLSKMLPDYTLVVVRNMSLEEYKNLIAKAQFCITFGEGFDGYFLEPFLSDSISFGVYNDTFFPHSFVSAPTIFSNWSDLLRNIVESIEFYSTHQFEYELAVKRTVSMIREHISDEISLRNIRDFYSRKYLYLPEIFQGDQLFSRGNDAISQYNLE